MILPKNGYIQLIIGTMYAGKTTELIRALKRFKYAKQKILLFTLDSRFEKKSKSHDGISIDSFYIEPGERNNPQAIYNVIQELGADVIGFDEIQFLDKEYVKMFKRLALDGKIVILAGLDQDFKARAFETTMLAVVEAEFVKKLTAVCTGCGNPALRNYRKIENEDLEVQGADDIYEAKCRLCYDKLMER